MFQIAAVTLFALPAFAQVSSFRSGAQILWRPQTISVKEDSSSFFQKVGELSQSLETDKLQEMRGLQRSVNFHYKSLRYEKDFFNVYKGVNLRSFWDGRVDFGLFNHKQNRGSQAMPADHNREPGHYELQLRWNFREH